MSVFGDGLMPDMESVVEFLREKIPNAIGIVLVVAIETGEKEAEIRSFVASTSDDVKDALGGACDTIAEAVFAELHGDEAPTNDGSLAAR
jgi:hypothetical protein